MNSVKQFLLKETGFPKVRLARLMYVENNRPEHRMGERGAALAGPRHCHVGFPLTAYETRRLCTAATFLTVLPTIIIVQILAYF